MPSKIYIIIYSAVTGKPAFKMLKADDDIEAFAAARGIRADDLLVVDGIVVKAAGKPFRLVKDSKGDTVVVPNM